MSSNDGLLKERIVGDQAVDTCLCGISTASKRDQSSINASCSLHYMFAVETGSNDVELQKMKNQRDKQLQETTEKNIYTSWAGQQNICRSEPLNHIKRQISFLKA